MAKLHFNVFLSTTDLINGCCIFWSLKLHSGICNCMMDDDHVHHDTEKCYRRTCCWQSEFREQIYTVQPHLYRRNKHAHDQTWAASSGRWPCGLLYWRLLFGFSVDWAHISIQKVMLDVCSSLWWNPKFTCKVVNTGPEGSDLNSSGTRGAQRWSRTNLEGEINQISVR